MLLSDWQNYPKLIDRIAGVSTSIRWVSTTIEHAQSWQQDCGPMEID